MKTRDELLVEIVCACIQRPYERPYNIGLRFHTTVVDEAIGILQSLEVRLGRPLASDKPAD